MGGVVVAGVLEIGDAVAQAAAACKGVGAVGDVAEETVSLCPHLSGEVSIILVKVVVTAVGQKGHGLHREGQDVAAALLVEPVHKVLLEPVERLPLRRRSVREAELAEHALKVVLVEVADVPEHGLVTPVARRHIHRVDNLLEVIVDDLDQSALLDIVLHNVIEVFEVVVAVVLADKVIQIHKELRSRYRAHELGRNRIDKVDELSAEGLEVGRGDGHAAQLL